MKADNAQQSGLLHPLVLLHARWREMLNDYDHELKLAKARDDKWAIPFYVGAIKNMNDMLGMMERAGMKENKEITKL